MQRCLTPWTRLPVMLACSQWQNSLGALCSKGTTRWISDKSPLLPFLSLFYLNIWILLSFIASNYCSTCVKMSLAVIQNPLSPTGYEEALAFFFHTQQEGVVNLGVLRRSLSGRTDYDYRDYNTETLFPVASTSGLEVAFYNGAVCLDYPCHLSSLRSLWHEH